MGIKKRRLIFPRSSVTNREHGTRPSVLDPECANPLRRPFLSELRVRDSTRMIRQSMPSGRSAKRVLAPDDPGGCEWAGVKIVRSFNSLERDLGTNQAVCPAEPDSTVLIAL